MDCWIVVASCVNKTLSTKALTDHCEKTTPTTMIMVDGQDSPAGPITQYNPIKMHIAGHEEPLALDTAACKGNITGDTAGWSAFEFQPQLSDSIRARV